MGPAGFQGIVVARVGYRSAARMFVVSEDDTYSGYGLEQLSQVFTVKEHRQLAASDVRDWLIAVGKALQKRRLIEKANAWARFVTGDFGADTSSDFAAMGIAELQTAGMPLADAKVVYSCLDGRRVEDGDSVQHSGVTTASDSRSSDATASLSEIAGYGHCSQNGNGAGGNEQQAGTVACAGRNTANSEAGAGIRTGHCETQEKGE